MPRCFDQEYLDFVKLIAEEMIIRASNSPVKITKEQAYYSVQLTLRTIKAYKNSKGFEYINKIIDSPKKIKMTRN